MIRVGLLTMFWFLKTKNKKTKQNKNNFFFFLRKRLLILLVEIGKEKKI